jgi:beta-lactamase regulating signal transducer with metallopeptidase domain
MSALQALAQLASSQIVNCLVLGIAIAAVAGAASALAGRKSSGVRFAIWFAALIAIASLFFAARPVTKGAAAAHGNAPEISLRPEWALYIFGAWVFFAAIGLARVVRGMLRVRSLKQNSTPLEHGLAASITSALPPVWRRFSLCSSEDFRVPAAIGFFRPMIVLPAWAVLELSAEELHTVVLHEAAHLQRWDDWSNLLQKIIRALLFFHPAVWWIESRLSIEREMSCDDMVLVGSRNARQYAACLVALAEKTHAHRSIALAQAAVSRLKHTAQRISKILDGRERRAKPMLAPVMAAMTAFGAISLVAVQHTPQLVSFRSAPASTNASTNQIARADKFDYVAPVDAPKTNAIAASLHVTNSAGAVRALATTQSHPHRSTAPRANPNLSRPSEPTEEARSRFERGKPAIVNAAMQQDTAPAFIYFVTQSELYDDFGNMTVTTSVWRIRIAKPLPAQTRSGAIPNKT